MPAIDFPNTPVDQETCVRAGKTWRWIAAKTGWFVVSSSAQNIDGGSPSSNYTSIPAIDGGTP